MNEKLTSEEVKRMKHGHESWSLRVEPRKDVYVGDPVQCPRCHRGWISPKSDKPCGVCQSKAKDARIAELEKKLEEAEKERVEWHEQAVSARTAMGEQHHPIIDALKADRDGLMAKLAEAENDDAAAVQRMKDAEEAMERMMDERKKEEVSCAALRVIAEEAACPDWLERGTSACDECFLRGECTDLQADAADALIDNPAGAGILKVAEAAEHEMNMHAQMRYDAGDDSPCSCALCQAVRDRKGK